MMKDGIWIDECFMCNPELEGKTKQICHKHALKEFGFIRMVKSSKSLKYLREEQDINKWKCFVCQQHHSPSRYCHPELIKAWKDENRRKNK